MLNVVIFLVCRNRATHLISSLNDISRLSRRNVFVRQAFPYESLRLCGKTEGPLWRQRSVP